MPWPRPLSPRPRPSSTGPGRTPGSPACVYLITFAASIPAAYYSLAPVLQDPSYIVGARADTRVAIGCLLDVVNALACVGTAVAVYPVARRRNETPTI